MKRLFLILLVLPFNKIICIDELKNFTRDIVSLVNLEVNDLPEDILFQLELDELSQEELILQFFQVSQEDREHISNLILNNSND